MPGIAVCCVLVTAAAVAGCAHGVHERAAGWSVAETAHVRVYTSVGATRAAQLADEMQRIRDRMAGTVLPCAFGGRSDRIVVAVLRRWELKEVFPAGAGAEYRTARYSWIPDFERQIVMPDEFDDETRHVYQHELAHHLVSSCFPRAPSWLQEGLAGFLQSAVIEGERVVIGLPSYYLPRGPRRDRYQVLSYLGARVQVVEREWLPPVEELVALSFDQFYQRESGNWMRRTANYAASWALVHMLEMSDPDLRRRFGAFLHELRRPEADPRKTFADSFRGVDLQARLDRYVRRGRMPYVSTTAPVPRRGAARVRQLSPGQAHLQWALLWSGAGDQDDAREAMVAHLAAARAHSDTRVRAHLLAAASLAGSGDTAAGEREVAEALGLAPRDAEALHALVELRLARNHDPTAAAARLQQVARSAEQLCALAAVELRRGNRADALGFAMLGLEIRPTSKRCRRHAEQARPAPAR
jgi:hypothetical protein